MNDFKEHVLEKIKRVCVNNSSKTAVVTDDEMITFGELWRLSDNLAQWIKSTRPDNEPIIVYGSKSPYMIICFLACVKSGHPYCPLDISTPSDRLNDIIDELDTPLLLDTEFAEKTEENRICINQIKNICSADTFRKECAEENWVAPDDTFYIIFTSGSTGKPKGVEITSNNICNFVEWSAGFFPEDIPILNQAAFSFDLSVMDTYTALTTGHCLCCLSRKTGATSKAIQNCLIKNNVGYIVSTPSFVNTLLVDRNFCEGNMPSIKGFRFCGEALTSETVRKIFKAFPQASIINTYGPTETTVAVTGIEVLPEMCSNPGGIPIGTTGSDCFIEICDGEIIIGGARTGKGYYKDPEKTEERFFVNDKGQRCYRTGDLGYEDKGILYCTGRMDSQIKYKGYRIELQDIESNIMNLEEVSEAVVLPKKRNNEIRSLVAFVVPAEKISMPSTPEEEFAFAKHIKEKLSGKIPDYMVPRKISAIERMPLSSNEKIDRKKLGDMI